MEPILRATAIYLILLILFRFVGKRTMAQTTTFDFVLLLIISEATQQAMVGEDFSLTSAFLIITTLLFIDVLFSLLKQKFHSIEKIVDGVPVLLIDNGKIIKERMDKSRIDEDDILESARKLQGLERMDQIKYAVLEKSGGITVIPK